MLQRAGHRRVHQRHAATEHIDQRLPAALVGDVNQIGTGLLPEKFTGDVRGAAGAGSAIRKSARLRF